MERSAAGLRRPLRPGRARLLKGAAVTRPRSKRIATLAAAALLAFAAPVLAVPGGGPQAGRIIEAPGGGGGGGIGFVLLMSLRRA